MFPYALALLFPNRQGTKDRHVEKYIEEDTKRVVRSIVLENPTNIFPNKFLKARLRRAEKKKAREFSWANTEVLKDFSLHTWGGIYLQCAGATSSRAYGPLSLDISAAPPPQRFFVSPSTVVL